MTFISTMRQKGASVSQISTRRSARLARLARPRSLSLLGHFTPQPQCLGVIGTTRTGGNFATYILFPSSQSHASVTGETVSDIFLILAMHSKERILKIRLDVCPSSSSNQHSGGNTEPKLQKAGGLCSIACLTVPKLLS